MKTPNPPFLALATLLALFPVAVAYADSTTPPTEQGSTPGTTPHKKHHHHHANVSAGDNTPNTNTSPKLDSKVPPGNNASTSH